MLADTGAAVLAVQEYALLGRLMSGIASSVPATALAAAPPHPLPSGARRAVRQPRGGESG